MVNGLDLGNYNIKSSEIDLKTGKLITFPARICKSKKVIDHRKKNDENLIILKDKKILVGEGEIQTETNKLDKELYKICFLTALARSTKNEKEAFKVVTGLPATQYTEKNIDRIKNEILSDKMYTFEIGGAEKNIIIEDLEVFPENAAPYYGMTIKDRKLIRNRELIMVNMGGGNTNVAYFKYLEGRMKYKKGSTIMNGSINLYSDFINAINGEFSLNKTLEDAEDIFRYGVEIYGEKQDLSFTKDIILDHMDKVFKEINLYSLKTSGVMFTGGGCKVFEKFLKSRIPNCMFQRNCLTATVSGLKKVGEKIWQKESL